MKILFCCLKAADTFLPPASQSLDVLVELSLVGQKVANTQEQLN